MPRFILTVPAGTVLGKGDVGVIVPKEVALERDSVTVCFQDLTGQVDRAVVLTPRALPGSQFAAGVVAL